MLPLNITLSYYKRKDVQEAIVEQAADREIAVRFNDAFGKRPEILTYPQEVLEFTKRGATSFHASEERWSSPLLLKTGGTRKDLDILRTGWDLVLDIDPKGYEYGRIATHLLCAALHHHGVENLSVKFSGNKGFHIAVPYESFPETVHGKETRLLFPEAPRRIALYLKEMIKKPLAAQLLAYHPLEDIERISGVQRSKLVVGGAFDPFSVIELDTVLISSRHLFRMPYSLHEKSGLVSLPIGPTQVLEFKREEAEPTKVVIRKEAFLKRPVNGKKNATTLLVQAFDFQIKEEGTEKKKNVDDEQRYAVTNAVPEEDFPPCIKNILGGMQDGRKRGLFVLVNFLTSVGWDYPRIEARIEEWNKKNTEPLREVLIKGQVRYHQVQKKHILPPNCENLKSYLGLPLCSPDGGCKRIKNPVNYALFRYRRRENLSGTESGGKEGPGRVLLTEQQKEMRRRFRAQKKENTDEEEQRNKE